MQRTYFSYRQNLEIIIGLICISLLCALAPSHSLASSPSGVTGLQLKATKGRILQVVGVLPDTPAAMVGIKKGDKIITMGGIYGTVQGIKDKNRKIVLKVDNNTNITINTTAVAGLAENVKGEELEQA